jgi:divalent metal cation (Fe/Co/Zn/Cd) transporter
VISFYILWKILITYLSSLDLYLEPVVNEEDYQNYRRAAKQHWDMMKQYYEKVRGSKISIFFF